MNKDEKRFRNQIDYVMENLDAIDRLMMLAEEASELSQAALKLARIAKGANPTPVPLEEAWDHLIEETTDVELSMKLAGVREDKNLERMKLERCVDRLKGESDE